ncbi:MAG: hypothetical protein ACFFAY_16340 [Promethearchaeota archaeon]
MAEQFLSRLKELEKRIDTLAQSLERMMGFMAAIPEMKDEIKASKDEILQALKAAPSGETGNEKVEAMYTLVKGQFDELGGLIGSAVEVMKDEIIAAIIEVPAAVAHRMSAAAPATAPTKKAAAPPARPVPAAEPIPEPTPESPAPEPEIVVTPAPAAPEAVTIPANRAMQVADQLEAILESLKMGCKAKDVMGQMVASRENIAKIVPTDPIHVKLDKMMSLVSSYDKRKELQARDILKLKKELRDEIPKYRPA